MSKKKCLVFLCKEPAKQGASRCEEHAPKTWRKRNPEAPSPYATPIWRRLRAEARARAGGRCERCGAPGSQADHITALALGGEFTGPLAWLCVSCHRTKTAQDAKEARRQLRELNR
jgi:5-methylcytosine-specific restriction endonuclease McrA